MDTFVMFVLSSETWDAPINLPPTTPAVLRCDSRVIIQKVY